MRKLPLLLSLLVLASPACKKNEPPPPPPPPPTTTTLPPAPSLSSVTLGNAIGDDKQVKDPLLVFGVKDTIYASVQTAGTGHVKLRALWSFVKGEKTAKVDETTIEFESSGPNTNEFHVSKPSGWPKGDYKVEIFLGDAEVPATTKTFKVG